MKFNIKKLDYNSEDHYSDDIVKIQFNLLDDDKVKQSCLLVTNKQDFVFDKLESFISSFELSINQCLKECKLNNET